MQKFIDVLTHLVLQIKIQSLNNEFVINEVKFSIIFYRKNE